MFEPQIVCSLGLRIVDTTPGQSPRHHTADQRPAEAAMTDVRSRIDEYLNSSRPSATSPPCSPIQPARMGAAPPLPQALDVRAPVNQRITAMPIARMGNIPVYSVGWPYDRLPTMTQRRAMHRAPSVVAVEHLLYRSSPDSRQAAFVWARNRGNRKGQNAQLRTLPFEVGSPARTTIEQLAKLAFTPQDLGLFVASHQSAW